MMGKNLMMPLMWYLRTVRVAMASVSGEFFETKSIRSAQKNETPWGETPINSSKRPQKKQNPCESEPDFVFLQSKGYHRAGKGPCTLGQ